MNKKPLNNKNKILFGAKCTLLAVAIIISTLVLIYDNIFPESLSNTLYNILRICSLVIVAIVMIFEIVPYIQLSNKGIQNIYHERDLQIENFGKFSKLIHHNDLLYKFQPIVNAKDGSIYAYESLMRTRPEVGLAPRDILKYAEISQKLYDIEYYTFFNTLRIYTENLALFKGKKVFINSIPSITLKDEHLLKLKEKFSVAAENSVIEILEDCEDTDESLQAFTKIQELFNCQIAIDDYGSGYSNEAKLIHNNPNYIKIDIELITSIDSDRKKQFLVSNIIQFASKYGIKVLAEGVETKEELQTLIELGVDLVQGFYLARPDSEILAEINPEIKRFIIGENIRLAKYNNDLNTYEAADNETIRLLDIALDKYTTINVKSGTVTLIGECDHTIEMAVITAPDSDCTINLENVNIKGDMQTTIQIGTNAKLNLNLIGENTLCKEGIRVPEDSELTVTGDGSLTVNADRNNGVCIGGNFSDSYGSMVFASTGVISINSSGDKIISIGGGKQSKDSTINLLKGKIRIVGYGIKAIGIGAVNGDTTIHTLSAELDIHINANDGVGVGALNGNLKFISNSRTNIKMQGEKIVGIGVIENGSGTVTLSKDKITVDVRGAKAVGVGSFDSNLDVVCSAEYVSVYGEGTNVCGIGNREGDGKIYINSGIIKSYILAANPNWFGTGGRNMVITGGNFIGGENGITEAVNSFGDLLEKVVIDNTDSYTKHIITDNGDYVYRAEKSDEADSICVFIPVQCELRDI
ncbi:MAG: EAL domain-containing protein [Ruminiclostridium sp.]|nr:EAL domain-containing protein [Ruminiclostridium sp.]